MVAAVPISRSAAASRPVSDPMKRLRDVPARTGRPKAASSPKRAISSTFFPLVLGKTKTGIEHDGIAGNTRILGDLERAIEEFELVGDHIGKLLPVAAGMHDADPGAGGGDHARHFHVLLQAEDVIDDICARADRQLRRRSAVGIDGNQHIRLAAQLSQ